MSMLIAMWIRSYITGYFIIRINCCRYNERWHEETLEVALGTGVSYRLVSWHKCLYSVMILSSIYKRITHEVHMQYTTTGLCLMHLQHLRAR